MRIEELCREGTLDVFERIEKYEGGLKMTLEEVVKEFLPWFGGLAGLAVIGFVGSAYHNWYVRKKLREIAQILRRRME